MKTKIEKSINSLPQKPGVYLFKNNSGRVLYVGKAKNLRKRAISYIKNQAKLECSKQLMMAKAIAVEHIVTDSELEALLLESNLIKKHRPRYNSLLKDDKSYKYIKIDLTWDYPKIYFVRSVGEDLSPEHEAQYFGPFTDAYAVNRTVELLRKLFKYRTCSREIPYDDSKKYNRPCLNYHIKKCLGPCIGAVSRETYENTIHNCVRFLQGKQEEIMRELKEAMQNASEKKDFELAALLRDQWQYIEKTLERQKIVSAKRENMDVIGFVENQPNVLSNKVELASRTSHRNVNEDKNAIESMAKTKVRMAKKNENEVFFNIFMIRNGKLLGKENFVLETPQDAYGQHDDKNKKTENLLQNFIQQYYPKTSYIPEKIILENHPAQEILLKKWLCGLYRKNSNSARKKSVKFIIPSKGKNFKLLKLSSANAREFMKQRKRKESAQKEFSKNMLKKLSKAIGLKNPPKRIEAYDISNIHGASAVGSMIVFTDARPDKKEYRRFKVKTISTPNDTAMIREVLTRRFSPFSSIQINTKDQLPVHNFSKASADKSASLAKKARWKKPDLVLIDGGKPQLSSAINVFMRFKINTPLAALAKRKEEFFVPEKSKSIKLKKDSPEFFLLQRIRDEAHRFAISYHRMLRTKSSRKSILDQIPGVGPKTKQKLLAKFGSIQQIKNASQKELEKTAGKKLARIIRENIC